MPREQGELHWGDSIAAFMERLSAGRCVLLILSADYLRSEYCMGELCRIWQRAGGRGDAFTRRIIPLVQPDARIHTTPERADQVQHWIETHDRLDERLRRHGLRSQRHR